MSLTDQLKRNAAASIALALSCGIAFSLSAGATEPVKPTDVKHAATQDEKTPIGGFTSAEKSAATNGDRHGVATGAANGVATKGATKSDAADGAKSSLKPDTKSDVTTGAHTGTATGTKDNGASGVAADLKKGTESDAVTGASNSETVEDTDAKPGAEKQITPLSSKSSEDTESEEDPYAAYNKQQMALFQQHEAVQHYNAAKYYMKNWENELAELELRAAIMYMPELRIAHRDYCIVAIVRGKILRAIAEFCMVFGIGEPIALTQEQQAALRTEASQAHYKKGLELATKGNWDESISELMWARTYLPNDPAVHRSLAFAYASKGDFKMAEQYYKSTFSINPDDAFAHADFAYLLSKKGKTNEAVSEMAKAVKADPDSPALHVDLGWLAESKGDLKTAEAEFRAALNRAPQYGQLWCHLGEILEKRKKTSDAIGAYKTAVEKESSNQQAKAALVRLAPPLIAPSTTTPVGAATTPVGTPTTPVATTTGPVKPGLTPLKPATQAASAGPHSTPLTNETHAPAKPH